MTDEEILTKAVEKAYKNDPNGFVAQVSDFVPLYKLQYNQHYAIIFNHDFAKAFWGNDELDECGRTLIEAWEEEWRDSGHFTDLEDYQYDSDIDFQIAWMYHLRQMVLSNKPLKYLEKFLKESTL